MAGPGPGAHSHLGGGARISWNAFSKAKRAEGRKYCTHPERGDSALSPDTSQPQAPALSVNDDTMPGGDQLQGELAQRPQGPGQGRQERADQGPRKKTEASNPAYSSA